MIFATNVVEEKRCRGCRAGIHQEANTIVKMMSGNPCTPFDVPVASRNVRLETQ